MRCCCFFQESTAVFLLIYRLILPWLFIWTSFPLHPSQTTRSLCIWWPYHDYISSCHQNNNIRSQDFWLLCSKTMELPHLRSISATNPPLTPLIVHKRHLNFLTTVRTMPTRFKLPYSSSSAASLYQPILLCAFLCLSFISRQYCCLSDLSFDRLLSMSHS